MRFVVDEGHAPTIAASNETYVILRRDKWDDFGFKTLFHAELRPAGAAPVDLGTVKILRLGQTDGWTTFDSRRFNALDENYCSLGQDIEYYEKLSKLSRNVRTTFLRAIRDAATDARIAAAFENEAGWTTSLLRFGQAEHTLAAARSLFEGTAPSRGVAAFRHRSRELQANLRFSFDDSGRLPGRCKVLIGYNGVGKTRLLAEVARDTSKVAVGQGPLDRTDGSAVFSAVIAVSYSAFDTFELPLSASNSAIFDDVSSTSRFGYTYCGLRRLQDGKASAELKSIGEIDAELKGAFRSASHRNAAALTEALSNLDLDPSFGRIGLRLADWVSVEGPTERDLAMLSAGQKIVLNITAQLAAHLRSRSLVLLDEPETHLHPPLLAALLRSIQSLLDAFDSFAIVATHSPVVLQEVPARDVQVIERFGSVVRATEPQIETFGAGLGELTHEVFDLDTSVADYRAVIRQLAPTMSIEQLELLFPLGLSSQARALAIRANREAG
jgi:ATPase subunit of ABC transporter with duplicated ATPase domains